MQAIILAAGKGERLYPLTRNTPKSLLDLGNGTTILEHQLDNIQKVGAVNEVLLVLGYRAEQVEAKLKGYKHESLKIKVVFNPFFAQSNNLISLWFASPYMSDDFVVINGDNVFRYQVLASLIEVKPEAGIVMVIDHKEKYDEEDMKVRIKGDIVTEVSKRIRPDKADGESIGMIHFRKAGARKLKSVLSAMVRREESKKVFWLAAIQQIIDEGFPVHFHVCSPDDWVEVDFHPDLQFARANIDRFAEVVSRWQSSSAQTEPD